MPPIWELDIALRRKAYLGYDETGAPSSTIDRFFLLRFLFPSLASPEPRGLFFLAPSMISDARDLADLPLDGESAAGFREAGASMPEGLRKPLEGIDADDCFCFWSPLVCDKSFEPSASLRSRVCLDGRKSIPTPFRESKIASRALLCEGISDDFWDSFFGWSSVSNPFRVLPDTEDIDLGFVWSLNLWPFVGDVSLLLTVDSGPSSPSSTSSLPPRSSVVWEQDSISALWIEFGILIHSFALAILKCLRPFYWTCVVRAVFGSRRLRLRVPMGTGRASTKIRTLQSHWRAIRV